MPRYYFNILDGESRIPDPEGEELPSVEVARQLVLADIRAIMHKRDRYGSHWDTKRIDITDEDGRSVLTLPFA